jgi:hypothetical protein
MYATRKAGGGKLSLCLSIALLLLSAASQAATISNLYNTGVNGGGFALPANVVDPHYAITVSPSGPLPAKTVIDTSFPFPPWVANNAGSRWIGPDASSQGPAGTYRYRTQFTVPANAILSTVNITGLWGTDDNSLNIFINGNPTGNVSAGFMTLVPFTVSSGFQYGTNNLVFRLNNAGGPTGLRVDNIVGTYQVVPEPIAGALVCVGLISGCGLHRRGRRS